MTNQLNKTIHLWLSLLGVRVNKKYLTNRLLSHPDYPSALSITRLLDDLSIVNGVAQISKDELPEIPTPFLALIDNDKFEIVKNIEKIDASIDGFWERWNGIVVAAVQPPENVMPKESVQADVSDKFTKFKIAIALSIVCLLSGFTLFQSSTFVSSLLVLNLIGTLISGFIVLQELGVQTQVTDTICRSQEQESSGCEAILKSKASGLPLGIKLSDIGFSFFCGNLLLLWLSQHSTEQFQDTFKLFITIASFLSIPVVLISIFYQWKIAKQWCKLCLLVVSTLVSMVLIVAWHLPVALSTDVMSTILTMCVFALPGSVWLLMRNTLNNKRDISNENILLQRFYRSPELFESVLLNQPKLDIDPWLNDFQLGNKNAPCQIIVVSSHFCGPCVKTFQDLSEFQERYHDRFGLTIRFLSDSTPKSSKKTEATKHMLQYALSNSEILNSPPKLHEMIDSWYQALDIGQFQKTYPVKSEKDVTSIVEEQVKWYQSAGITFTPTIFINGYRLNDPFEVSDLIEFGETLLDMFPEKQTELVR